MSQLDTLLSVVNYLTSGAPTLIENKDLANVICTILKPHSDTKVILSKEIKEKLGQIFISRGICSRCRFNALRLPSDAYCKFCKSALREAAKS